MELQTYLTILWRRKWIIAITAFVTVAIVGLGTSKIEPQFAASGWKIIVVDSDLRLPTLHKIFELNNEGGVSNVLRQEVPLPEAIQYSHIAGVQVLTSGPLPPNTVDLKNIRTWLYAEPNFFPRLF